MSKRVWIPFIFPVLLLFSCKKSEEAAIAEIPKDKPVYDLKEIKERGQLRALVDYSSTSYFIYKGQPMGYEYELLSRFAEHLDVELVVIPINDMDKVMELLTSYQGDVIASNLTITEARAKKVEFSVPILKTKQVLIQRQDGDLVKTLFELKEKEIHVRRHSSFYDRLDNLSSEIGGGLNIKTVSGEHTVEELMMMVSEGKIDYTVADRHVARINSSYYQNINTSLELSLPQHIAWAVRKESPDLKIAMDNWLKDFKETVDFRVIYLKYYGNTSLFKKRVRSKYFASKTGRISEYDALIKSQAEMIGWDWRLLASLIYQESGFDPTVTSWMGAKGLMQIMPATAEQMGIDSNASPEMNLKAGVRYLNWLDNQLKEKIPSDRERVKFILASYNVGLGHVYDAMRLAEKYDKDPDVWKKNVELMLLNKMKPKFYKDEVVKHGYCRGSETYAYVNEIYNRYRDYKNIMEH